MPLPGESIKPLPTHSMNPRKRCLINAAMLLAKRSENTKWEARLYADSRAETLTKKSCLQQLASLRLLRWAGC